MFTYGLSLANHWPTAATMIFIPVAASWTVVSNKRSGHILAGMSLAVLGLTPYLYLPIRAWAGPLMNMGNPRGLNAVLDVIFRRMYPNSLYLNPGSILSQAKAVFVFFAASLSIFALFSLLSIFKKNKKAPKFHLLLWAVAAINIITIVVFNRTDPLFEEFGMVFLLPSCLALSLLAPTGMELAAESIKTAAPRAVFMAALVIMALICAAEAYISSDGSNDFLGYDHGMNILKTPQTGGTIFASGDYNVFPAQFLGICLAKRPDLRIRRGGNAGYTETAVLPAYMTSYSEQFVKGGYKAVRLGIIFELAEKGRPDKPIDGSIWKVYSYRGMIGGLKPRDSMENYLLSSYSSSMLIESEVLAAAGRGAEAKYLLNLSMAVKGLKAGEAVERAQEKVIK
jgi:hypothetical protein